MVKEDSYTCGHRGTLALTEVFPCREGHAFLSIAFIIYIACFFLGGGGVFCGGVFHVLFLFVFGGGGGGGECGKWEAVLIQSDSGKSTSTGGKTNLRYLFDHSFYESKLSCF